MANSTPSTQSMDFAASQPRRHDPVFPAMYSGPIASSAAIVPTVTKKDST